MLLTILKNKHFLERQRLAFRGNEDQENIDQQMKLYSKVDSRIKKTLKYFLSHSLNDIH